MDLYHSVNTLNRQRPLAVFGDAGSIDVGAQRLGERVMARHRVLLPPFSCSWICQLALFGRGSSTFMRSAAFARALQAGSCLTLCRVSCLRHF